MTKELADKLDLNERQHRFADLYIIYADPSKSYIEAGYAASSKGAVYTGAHALLKNPKVVAYLAEKQGNIDNINIAKQEEVLEFLTSVMRGKVQEKAPLGLGYGAQKLVSKIPDVRDRVKAGELLGRRYGTFLDRSEMDIQTQVHIIDDIPTEVPADLILPGHPGDDVEID